MTFVPKLGWPNIGIHHLFNAAFAAQTAGDPPRLAQPIDNLAERHCTTLAPLRKQLSKRKYDMPAKYAVFVSHNSRDKPLVRPLAAALIDQLGSHQVFFDESCIGYGQNIPDLLEQALEESQSVVVCFGPHGQGPWHKEEIAAFLTKTVSARSHQNDGKTREGQDDFRVIPALMPGADPTKIPWLLKTRLWADFREGIVPEVLDGLVRAIKGERGTSSDQRLDLDANPYRGLEPFTETGKHPNHPDYLYFCGRERECGELAQRLKDERFVLVSGASGCGKSSLVRAGLRTDASELAYPGIRDWKRIRFVPGHDVLHAFANAVINSSSGNLDSVPTLRDRLRSALVSQTVTARERKATYCPENGAVAIHELLLERFPAETDKVLVIFDQFEELFTHPGTAAESPKEQALRIEASLNCFAALAPLADRRFCFVFTLRADFRLRLCLSRAFSSLVFEVKETQKPTRKHYPLDELDDTAWRVAIKSPAEKACGYFEPGLVSSILKDVYRQRGSMPLLQHALAELWKQPSGACLTSTAYDRIGGVQSALQQTGDTILGKLAARSSKHDTLCRNLILRLVGAGSGVPDSRRRVTRAELDFGIEYEKDLHEIIQALKDKETRLLTEDDQALEVTHEALIRECRTVREWIEDARKSFDLPLSRQLTDAARYWQASGRSSHDLWSGKRLRDACNLLEPQKEDPRP